MLAGSAPLPLRAQWRLLLVLSAVAALALLLWISLRIGYPYELEWMEGAMVDETARVLAGEPSYHAPDLGHLPFLYTPLYYWAGAAVAAVVGQGYFALRLVSVLCTVGCMALLSSIAHRETGRRRAGLCAAGLFAMGYGWLQSWYDLGRNDMLFLCCMLACWRLLRAQRKNAWAMAAVAALLAFLAKQTALMWLPALAIAACIDNPRRGLPFAATAALLIGGCVACMHALTDGWSTFYVFTMPTAHHWQLDKITGFFTEDLVPVLPLLALGAMAILGRWRQDGARTALALAAAAGGGLVASYVSRLHVGGFDNVLVYGFAALCALGPMACFAAARPWQRESALILLLLQFAMLTIDLRSPAQDPLLYDPRRLLPTSAHRHAFDELRAFVREQDGPVWLPFQGWIAPTEDKPPTAHGQALADLIAHIKRPGLRPDDRAAVALDRSLRESLQARRFAAIVVQDPYVPVFLGDLGPYLEGYEPSATPVVKDPLAVRPLVGMNTHSPRAFVPRR